MPSEIGRLGSHVLVLESASLRLCPELCYSLAISGMHCASVNNFLLLKN